MSLIEKITYLPGDIVYSQNDMAQHVFLLNEGTIELILRNDKGNDELVRTVTKGQMFGEVALNGIYPRWYSAKAKTDAKCICISVKKLNKRIEEQDPFIAALYRILVTNLNSIREMNVGVKSNLDIMIELAESVDI